MPSAGRFYIVGERQVRRNLEMIASSSVTLRTAANVFQEEGEVIITAGKEQTPVLTGALKNSGKVLPAKITPKTVETELGFGGPSTPHHVNYAIPVHEMVWIKHHVGNAKFLERPFFAHYKNVFTRLRKELNQSFRRSVHIGNR